MRNSIQKVALAGMALVFVGLMVSSAEASHGKYCYRGTCHNFHGESHVIQAFALMDEALVAHCRVDRIHTTLAAQREIMTAFREFCDRTARHELLQAKIDLSRYIGHGDPCYLDHAAQHMNTAMAIEQRIHVHQPVHVGHADLHGHGRGHSISLAPRYSNSYGQPGRTQIRLGGTRYSFGFSF
jgi:hypothetical protein